MAKSQIPKSRSMTDDQVPNDQGMTIRELLQWSLGSGHSLGFGHRDLVIFRSGCTESHVSRVRLQRRISSARLSSAAQCSWLSGPPQGLRGRQANIGQSRRNSRMRKEKGSRVGAAAATGSGSETGSGTLVQFQERVRCGIGNVYGFHARRSGTATFCTPAVRWFTMCPRVER